MGKYQIFQPVRYIARLPPEYAFGSFWEKTPEKSTICDLSRGGLNRCYD